MREESVGRVPPAKDRLVVCQDHQAAADPIPSIQRERGMSFREWVDVARAQVGMDEWPLWERPRARAIAHDMCLIMADVYRAPAGMLVRIDGEEMTAGMVAEVYRELTSDHIREAAEQVAKRAGNVRNVKPYLRSVLYNVVLGFETAAVRDLDNMMPLG